MSKARLGAERAKAPACCWQMPRSCRPMFFTVMESCEAGLCDVKLDVGMSTARGSFLLAWHTFSSWLGK